MSKIDTSCVRKVGGKGGYWSVLFRGKYYNYFTSKAGAKAYLEVLKNGADKETGVVSKVSRVLQDNSRKSGDKPRERKDFRLLFDEGL